MPFNGSGTFNLTGGYPYVPNTTIVSANVNALLADVASGLSDCVTRDAQGLFNTGINIANDLSYTPLGSGAVATTIGARLNQSWVYDAAWGADPTNTTDNSTNISEALTALGNAGGGELIIPAGTYKWASTSPVTVPGWLQHPWTRALGERVFRLGRHGADV
jgi:hypothetical protein